MLVAWVYVPLLVWGKVAHPEPFHGVRHNVKVREAEFAGADCKVDSPAYVDMSVG
jgi:hypothetical protein